MAKRYYVSRVLGTGTNLDPYYSELRRYISDNWPNEPHFIFQFIHPSVLSWCIMKYDLSQAAHDDVVENVTQLFDFPETGLDRTMAEIPVAKRDAIEAKLNSIGFDFSWATLTTTVRQILKFVIWSIQLASWAEVSIAAVNDFDLNTRVVEIPLTPRNNIKAHMDDLGIPTDWIGGQTTMRDIMEKINYNDDWTRRLFGVNSRGPWMYEDDDEF